MSYIPVRSKSAPAVVETAIRLELPVIRPSGDPLRDIQSIPDSSKFRRFVDARRRVIKAESNSTLREGSVVRQVGAALAEQLRGRLVAEVFLHTEPRGGQPYNSHLRVSQLSPTSMVALVLTRVDTDLFQGSPDPVETRSRSGSRSLRPEDRVAYSAISGLSPEGQSKADIEEAVRIATVHALYKLTKYQIAAAMNVVADIYEAVRTLPEFDSLDLRACGIGQVRDVMATMLAALAEEHPRYRSDSGVLRLRDGLLSLKSRLLKPIVLARP